MSKVTRVVGIIDYTTQEGDTFDMLALQLYSEETAAGYIMDANPDYAGTLAFKAGVRLRLPVVETVDVPETLPPWER